MAKKIEKGDDVLIRGEVVWIDDNGIVRVKIRGYQYPITVDPEMVEAFVLWDPIAPCGCWARRAPRRAQGTAPGRKGDLPRSRASA